MAEASLESLLVSWSKLAGYFASAPSSSVQLDVPVVVKLNDMVYEVYRPPHHETPELEIIFFHGLQLKACKEAHITTWMSRDNSEFWPQAWLAQEFPKARILTVAYDSFAKQTTEKRKLDMYLTRENLLWELTTGRARVGEARCPIVLVGHCLGGLLLKELCLHSNMMLSEKRDDIPGMQHIHNFFNNLRGMFFYGTPHLGSFIGEKLRDCLNSALMEEIAVLNANSARKNASFFDLKSRHKWLTYGVGETQETFLDVLGKKLHVVPEASSREGMDRYYSIDANHLDLCKPQGKKSSAFSFLEGFVRQIQAKYILQSRVEADALSGRGYVVDLKGRAQKVVSMLAKPNAHTIFIVGLSGIGKTTLAQQVFHDISHNFAISCFICLGKFNPDADSKEEILGKIEIALKRQGEGSRYGHFSVPHYLKSRKVMIVLDNVQSQSQLDALSRNIWLEGSNSRVLVTTRNSRLASASNVFTVEYLQESESKALFRHYAFAGDDIPHELTNSIEQVITRCGGFPLALEILGRYLSAEDVTDQNLWTELIVRLENAEELGSDPDYKLWGRLRPCYDALQRSEQEMFLDAALVFSGYPLSLVEHVWSACANSPTVAWTNLRRGFLVHEFGGGGIWMHELLRNLARSIACPPSNNVDRWRRICSGSFERNFVATHQGMVESRSLEIQVQDNERLTLRNTTLSQYFMLQYLILDGVEMTEGSVELPRSLVYLKWKGASFETCPVDFNGLPNLAVLDLQCCKAMRDLPPGVVTAKKLKWLELEGCLSLAKLPKGLYELSDLEYLGLSMTGVRNISRRIGQLKKLRWFRADRTRLAQVPDSIVRLGALTTLDISGTTVTALPEAIGDLKQLRTLSAKNSCLAQVPDSIGRIKALKTLYLDGTSVTVLPESIGCLTNLRMLCLDNTGVTILPESLGKAFRLQTLSLNATPLELLPKSLCSLRSLDNLYLEDTLVSTLPDAFGELERLGSLSLRGSRVRSLPENFSKLSNLSLLRLTVSTSLDDGTHSGSGACSTVPRSSEDWGCLLNVELNFERGEVEERDATLAVRSPFLSPRLPLHRIYSVRISWEKVSESVLPTLFHSLKTILSLRRLTLERFTEVEALPAELGTLTSLTLLIIRDCQKLLVLPDLTGVPNLKGLSLVELPRLRTLPAELGTITSLTRLSIRDCQNLLELPDLWGLLNLTSLQLENLPRLRALPEAVFGRGKRSLLLTVRKCGSLQSTHLWRFFGHTLDSDRDSSSNPMEDKSFYEIYTDSWSLLRCLLECNPIPFHGERHRITLSIKLEEMERVTNMAMQWETDEDVELKVGTRVMRKLCMDSQASDDSVHGSLTPSTIWPPLSEHSFPQIYLAGAQAGDTWPMSAVRVMDEEDSGGQEEESDKETSDEDTGENEDADGGEDHFGTTQQRHSTLLWAFFSCFSFLPCCSF